MCISRASLPVTSEEIPSITVSAISTSQTSHRSPSLGPPLNLGTVICLWHPWLRINRRPARDGDVMLFDALQAFFQEHQYCGELDGGVEGDR
jgi:hypothetical protein